MEAIVRDRTDSDHGSDHHGADGSSAKTGDATQASLWMMLMLASMLAAVYTYAAAQKRNSRF